MQIAEECNGWKRCHCIQGNGMQKGLFPLWALPGKSYSYFQAKEPPLKGFGSVFKVLSWSFSYETSQGGSQEPHPKGAHPPRDLERMPISWRTFRCCALLAHVNIQKFHLQALTSDVSILFSWQLQVEESEVIQQSAKQPLNTCGKVHTWQEKVQSSAQSTAAGSFLSIYLSRTRKPSSALWQSQANILFRDAIIIPSVPGNILLPSLPSCQGGV